MPNARKKAVIVVDELREWTQPVGTIVATHGIKGAVKVHPRGETVASLFAPGQVFCLLAPTGRRQKVTVESAYPKGANFIVKFAEFTHIAQAQQCIGTQLTVHKDWKPTLQEGEFLAAELVGMDVVTEGGDAVGQVVEVVSAAAHDLLVTERGMIPMVRQFIKTIDRKNRRIVITPPPGLLEEVPRSRRSRWRK
ncbi:Ribosome maturation factor RimM [bacterium HR17]|jgi:16S rRNA processing protein RimM|uniref:Ribosome maturation factor RimM n=1 Tax=Candidatus Fervidibacter japonicus TaxID=2035412 RepID=A0A2H5X8Y0_9BACT|nr:Ribosome maturation factor RimM [bacterium HR17]